MCSLSVTLNVNNENHLFCRAFLLQSSTAFSIKRSVQDTLLSTIYCSYGWFMDLCCIINLLEIISQWKVKGLEVLGLKVQEKSNTVSLLLYEWMTQRRYVTIKQNVRTPVCGQRLPLFNFHCAWLKIHVSVQSINYHMNDFLWIAYTVNCIFILKALLLKCNSVVVAKPII